MNAVRFRRRYLWGVLFLLAVYCTGCVSTFSEKHYFKAPDQLEEPLNYYQLKVHGWTALVSSRYLSGYFDERAVDAYFSEYTQPEKGKFSETIDTGGQNVVPLSGGDLGNRSLLLILTSNSDAIATQIGTLAQSQEITDTLTRMAFHARIEEGQLAVADLDYLEYEGKALAALGDRYVGQLNLGDATEAEIQGALLQFVNALANTVGHVGRFDSLDEAARWIEITRPSQGGR